MDDLILFGDSLLSPADVDQLGLNLAVPGMSVKQFPLHMAKKIVDQLGLPCVVELVTNDWLHHNEELEQFVDKYRLILKTLKPIACVGMHMAPSIRLLHRKGLRKHTIRHFNCLVETIAKEEGIYYISGFQSSIEMYEGPEDDGLHMNKFGRKNYQNFIRGNLPR